MTTWTILSTDVSQNVVGLIFLLQFAKYGSSVAVCGNYSQQSLSNIRGSPLKKV